MNGTSRNFQANKRSLISPSILRITLLALLYALAIATVASAQELSAEHRDVQNFPTDRARVENLQRWVNGGHDTWCRHPEFVAAAALKQVAPHFAAASYEPVSLPAAKKGRSATAIYVYHSFDGRTTYRITLRRYRWLLPMAGTEHQMVWVPVQSEKITRATLD
jgi:hypothetical protein